VRSLGAAFLAAAIVLTSPLEAQEDRSPTSTRSLTLTDAIVSSLHKNHDLTIERESLRIAEASLRKTDGSYDPTLKFESKVRDRIDPVNSILSGAPAGEVAPKLTTLSGSSSLSRLCRGGGTASISAAVARDWTDNFFTLLAPAYTTALTLEFRQPILQNRKIDATRKAIRVARTERDRSVSSLKRMVTETVAAVEKSYWTLVAARRDTDVRRDSVVLAQEQWTDTKARVDAGVLGPTELSQPAAEVEKRKGELYASEEQVRRAEHQLKLLILDNPTDPEWNTEYVPAQQPSPILVAIDPSSAIRKAIEVRPELVEAQAQVSKQKVEVEAARDHIRPQLDLVASYSRRGFAGQNNPNVIVFPGMPTEDHPELVGGLGRSIGTLGADYFPDASVGAVCSVPLGNRAAKEDFEVARSGSRQAWVRFVQTQQKIAVEVRNAIVALRTAWQRIEAARAGRTAAEVQLQAERDRFIAGVTTNFMVLTRQNDLVQARITETAALTDYEKARVEYCRSVGTLLADRQIEIVGSFPSMGSPSRRVGRTAGL